MNDQISRRSTIFLGQRHTNPQSRLIARLIDTLTLLVIYLIGERVSPFFASITVAALAGAQDWVGNGQSLGKRIIGLRVIDDTSSLSCPLHSSVIRNLPMVLLLLALPYRVFIPIVLLALLPIAILECYLLSRLQSGVRFCDVLSSTLVVEIEAEELSR